MPIQMTREQYEKTYGKPPAISTAPTSSVGGTISNAFNAGIEKTKAGYNQSYNAKNPLELIEGGLKQGAGIVETAFSPLAPVGKVVADTVINPLANKISDIPAVQNFATSKAGEVTNRAVEDIADINTIAGALTGGKGGNKVATNLEKAVIPESIAIKKLTETIKSSTAKAPENIMQRVARIPKGAQAKFEQMAGESVGKYLTKRGIYGNVDEISSQLYKRFQNSKGEADSALAKLPGEYQPAPIKTALNELTQREGRVSSEGAPSPDLARVTELSKKLETSGLNHSEINEVKRIYERNIKLDFLKQNLPEGVARANNIDSAIRKWQLEEANKAGLKNLDKINKETQLSKQLVDSLGKEYSGSKGNNAISLTDWIMLSGGDPTSIAGFLTKKTFSSKSVQSAIAKALNRKKPIMGEVKANFSKQPPQR